MFQLGDLIFYGDTGVCRITDIKPLDISNSGQDELYYILKPLFQDYEISTPVENNKIFMRPILSKEAAERLIDRIPSIHAEVYNSRETRELTAHYEASIMTHNCEDLIQLAMSIHAKKRELEDQNKKIRTLEEGYMKRAEDLLFGELSASLRIPKEKVPDYIDSRVGAINHKIEVDSVR
ncbi:CarD family transcriptional regulator [Gorillibacterium massiliense]|uniref:CarD family transcriptional regulator n=1 Tax=Gorillibacterium massiliense TaxID=1280390 RepID=UPI0004BAA274|nr:CarD family transcriptional regulator [Gorillibacterium massiliense]